MQGEFRRCKSCGQIYRNAGKPFCSTCVIKMDEDFKKIKEYLYENPNAPIAQVVKETEVEEWIVFYLLKEGRLEMKAAADYLKCRSCGAPIRTGTVCDACTKKLSEALGSVVRKNRPAGRSDTSTGENKGKMYTDSRRK